MNVQKADDSTNQKKNDKSVFNDPFFLDPDSFNKKQQKLKKMQKRQNKYGRRNTEAAEADERNEEVGNNSSQINKRKGKKRRRNERKGKSEDSFEVDTKDKRFESLYDDPEFNVDRTSSLYKDTPASRKLEAEKHKRRSKKYL